MTALGLASILALAATGAAAPLRFVSSGLVHNEACGYLKNEAVTFIFTLNEARGEGEQISPADLLCANCLRWPAANEPEKRLFTAVTGSFITGNWNSQQYSEILSSWYGPGTSNASLYWAAQPTGWSNFIWPVGTSYNDTNLIANGKWPVGITFDGSPFPWHVPAGSWNNYFSQFMDQVFLMHDNTDFIDQSVIQCPDFSTANDQDISTAYVNTTSLVITTQDDCTLVNSFFKPGDLNQVLSLTDLQRQWLVSLIGNTWFCPFLTPANTFLLYPHLYVEAPWKTGNVNNLLTIVDWGGANAAVVTVLPPTGASLAIAGVTPSVGPTRRILFILNTNRFWWSGRVADAAPFEFHVTVSEDLAIVMFFRGENRNGVHLTSLNVDSSARRVVDDNMFERISGDVWRVTATQTGMFIGYGEEDTDESNEGLLGLVALIILPLALCACIALYFFCHKKQVPVRMDPPKDMSVPMIPAADPFWPTTEILPYPAAYPVAAAPYPSPFDPMAPPPPLPVELMAPGFGGLPSTPMPYPMMP